MQRPFFDIFQLHFCNASCIMHLVLPGLAKFGIALALGCRRERRLRRMQRPEAWAVVEKIEDKRKPDDFFGYHNPGDQSNPLYILQFHIRA